MKHWMIVVLIFVASCNVAAAEPEAPQARRTYDLAEAVANGAIELHARGGGVNAMTLELTARSDLDLVIPAGTFFRAQSEVQNMVVMKTATARLERGKAQSLVIATACASFHRAAPSPSHRFELAVAEPALQRLAACLEHESIDDGRKQMLIWKLTDGTDRAQAMQRRDLVRPYLVETCARKLRRDRCERIVDATYERLVERLFAHRAEDERICGMSQARM
jgi:hypothetical protein